MQDINVLISIIIGILTIVSSIAGASRKAFEKQQETYREMNLLSHRISELESRLLIRLEQYKGSQNLDDYKFITIENQQKELERHIKDAERFLAAKMDYALRPYTVLDDTILRKKNKEQK